MKPDKFEQKAREMVEGAKSCEGYTVYDELVVSIAQALRQASSVSFPSAESQRAAAYDYTTENGGESHTRDTFEAGADWLKSQCQPTKEPLEALDSNILEDELADKYLAEKKDVFMFHKEVRNLVGNAYQAGYRAAEARLFGACPKPLIFDANAVVKINGIRLTREPYVSIEAEFPFKPYEEEK